MNPRKSPFHDPSLSPADGDGGLAAFLRSTYPGPRQVHKALSLWPLLTRPGARPAGGPAYVPLADALEDGLVSVAEVDAAGSVPHVRVENRAATAVLVLFGEELRGAKQNRVANASFLLPPREACVIDVSCVEQGRWSFRGATGLRFAGSGATLSSAIRYKMLKKVALSRARSGRYDADQGEVWHEVGERLARSGVRSPSAAYADYARSRARDVGEMAKSFRVVEDAGQVGFVAAIGDAIVGLEAVGRPEVFARVFPKLLHGYAIDAVDAGLLGASAPRARFDGSEDFLAAVAGAPARSGPSLAMGRDLRLASDAVEGCALLAAGAVVHLTAFPCEAD